MRSSDGTDTVVEGATHSRQNSLYKNVYTSKYGTENPGEFFEEAFHDVYANGDKSRKASTAAVQEYERRQKKLTTEKFFRKKQGLLRRFMNWIKLF